MKKFFILWLFCTSVQALEVSYGSGEHKFTSPKDKRNACVLAQNKALEDALLKYAGREFTVESEQSCVDTKEHAYCNYIREIDSSTAGSVRKINETVTRSDKDTCYVEVEVEIEKARQLGAKIKLNRIYYTGDPINVNVNVNEPLYLYVFSLHKKGVDVLFPNEYNTNNLIDDTFVFPGKIGRAHV